MWERESSNYVCLLRVGDKKPLDTELTQSTIESSAKDLLVEVEENNGIQPSR
jgi:hypothetical protein